jgi:hypothetical protein
VRIVNAACAKHVAQFGHDRHHYCQETHRLIAAAVSESGTVGDCTREEVEMFCLSQIIYCMMDIDAENMFIDWRVSSTPDGTRRCRGSCHTTLELACL